MQPLKHVLLICGALALLLPVSSPVTAAEIPVGGDPSFHEVMIPLKGLIEKAGLEEEFNSFPELHKALLEAEPEIRLNYIIEKRPLGEPPQNYSIRGTHLNLRKSTSATLAPRSTPR